MATWPDITFLVSGVAKFSKKLSGTLIQWKLDPLGSEGQEGTRMKQLTAHRTVTILEDNQICHRSDHEPPISWLTQAHDLVSVKFSPMLMVAEMLTKRLPIDEFANVEILRMNKTENLFRACAYIHVYMTSTRKRPTNSLTLSIARYPPIPRILSGDGDTTAYH